MGKPILHYVDLSPPARAVLLTAKRIGVELEAKTVNPLAGDTQTPEFLKVTIIYFEFNNSINYLS